MDNMDSASRSPRGSRSNSKEKTLDRHKLFVTNLDGTANEKQLQDELRRLFEDYGKVNNLTVRRSKNGEYSFGFVEYESGIDAQKAIDNLNGKQVKDKAMKVEFQDNSKRRKDSDKGCYNCGRMGHFARECHSKNTNGSRAFRGRSRSRSRSHDRKKRHNRSPSESSDKERSSRHKRKKQRKDRSRDKDQKKKKKHKKARGSSSDS